MARRGAWRYASGLCQLRYCCQTYAWSGQRLNSTNWLLLAGDVLLFVKSNLVEFRCTDFSRTVNWTVKQGKEAQRNSQVKQGTVKEQQGTVTSRGNGSIWWHGPVGEMLCFFHTKWVREAQKAIRVVILAIFIAGWHGWHATCMCLFPSRSLGRMHPS